MVNSNSKSYSKDSVTMVTTKMASIFFKRVLLLVLDSMKVAVVILTISGFNANVRDEHTM